MKIMHDVLFNFFNEEKINTILIIIFSCLLSFLKINAVSYITANIIKFIQKNNIDGAYKYYLIFIFITIFYLIIYYLYKNVQNKLLSKLKHFVRFNLIKFILELSNENLVDINFTKLNSPIFRFSNNCLSFFSTLFSTIVPNITIIIVIFIFFISKDTTFGFIFLIGNFLYILYIYYILNYLYNKNYNYEKNINQNENFIIEILNNIDKIIFRGKIKDEINNLKIKTNNLYNTGYDLYQTINNRFLILYSIIYVTMFILIGYLIYLFSIKKIKNTIFVTFLTMLLLYRELILISVQFIPDYIEFIARLKNLSVYFIDFEDLKNNEIIDSSTNKYIKSKSKKELSKITDSEYAESHMSHEINNDLRAYDSTQSLKESPKILNKNYDYSNLDNKNLKFKNIEFININFKYKNRDKQIFNNFNKKINIDDKIIGLIGLSGNGKSTFAKLLIKMYKYDGTILIDNINIKNIDSEYLRKNIIYVNQNSKLFDKTIIKNIIYGCENNMEHCNKYLNEIMQFKKIRDLYKNIDFETTKAGLSGESLSGGQRQIINLINGLIVPSQIVILDEPTNALDQELKKDVIQLIKYFKKYKKCIIIITHDKDVFSIFDEKIEM